MRALLALAFCSLLFCGCDDIFSSGSSGRGNIAVAQVPPVCDTGTLSNPIRVVLTPPSSSSSAAGTATIWNVANAPDQMTLTATGLVARTRYTVFMANSPLEGALPINFLGEFVTDAVGAGTFGVVTEIINKFDIANHTLEVDGVAGQGAGAANGDAVTNELNFIRIYTASGAIGLFGGCSAEISGGVVLRSNIPLQ